MNTYESISNRLQAIREEVAKIPLSVAESQVVPENLKQFAPNIINEKMKEKTARAMEAVATLIDRKVEELDLLYTKTAGEFRKSLFPLSTATSPLKQEEARYLDQHALAVVQATYTAGDAGALSDAMRDASTLDEVEAWSWLAYWTRLIFRTTKLPDAEKIASALSMYDNATNRSEWETALKRIDALKNQIRSQKALLSTPSLFNPSTFMDYERALQARGMA
jgi:hypothetical protein